jgi:hypothetical protein
MSRHHAWIHQYNVQPSVFKGTLTSIRPGEHHHPLGVAVLKGRLRAWPSHERQRTSGAVRGVTPGTKGEEIQTDDKAQATEIWTRTNDIYH